jgi:excisionase family DNA binding protein
MASLALRRVRRADQIPPRLFDITNAANYLSMSDKGVRELIVNGELPYIQKIPGRSPYLLDRIELDKWIERNKRSALRTRVNGRIFRQKGCETWTLQYYANGKRIRESTGTPDHQKAQLILRQRLTARDKGEAPDVIRKVKVRELHEGLMRFYRINGRKSILKVDCLWKNHLDGYFGEMVAALVTTSAIERYVDLRLAEHAAVATVNRELAALKTAFHIAARNQTVARVPLFPPMMKENNVRTGFLEDAQFKKLIENAHELWLRLFLELSFTYGWRRSELLHLKVRQVDLLSRLIRLDVGTTKNREGREVSMSHRVYCLLKEAVAGKQPDDYVLTRLDGSRIIEFRGTWRQLCRQSGVEGLLVHDFRRSAARALRRAGVAESVIMDTGGWKTPAMFRRYAIVSNADQRNAMEMLERSRAENGHDFGHDSPVLVQSETEITTGKLN